MEEYLEQAEQDRQDMVDNLETQGISGLSGSETFTQLVPQILNIARGGGSNLNIDYIYDRYPQNAQNQIINFDDLTKGIYILGNYYVQGNRISYTVNNGTSKYFNPAGIPMMLIITKTVQEIIAGGSTQGDLGVVWAWKSDTGQLNIQKIYLNDTTLSVSSESVTNVTSFKFVTAGTQTFNGNKAFQYAPQILYTTGITDYCLIYKKYVDDLPTTYTGYDATKTQVLKNVNGTLTWVDE